MERNISGLILVFWAGSVLLASHHYYGVQTHFGQFYRADMDTASVIAMLDSVQTAGIELIRDECYWSEIEKERGVFQFPKQIDFYLSEARQRNINILLILNYNNPLYAAHAGSAVSVDSNRAAYARYCTAVVSRYVPLGVNLYEIWNEPNIPIFWDPTPNAAEYAELLKVAYPAIKKVEQSITVLGCATSPAEGNPYPFIDWLTFIEAVYNQGGGDYMDGVSFHLYRFSGGPESWLFSDIGKIQQIVGTDKTLWITEIGYPTSQVWPAVPLQTQANYLSRLYLLGRSVDVLQMITYYDLKNDGQDPKENEHNFGLLNFNLSAKPAFKAIQLQTSLLKNQSLITTSGSGNNYYYRFGNDSLTTDVVWNSATSAVHTANILSGRSMAVSIKGEILYYAYTLDGNLEIELTQDPKYFIHLQSFPPITDFNLMPAVHTYVIGQKSHLNLKGETRDSIEVRIDNGSCITWELSNNLAEIDSTGFFRAKEAGEVILTAKFDGYEFSQNLTIMEPFDYLEIESFDTLKGLFFNTEHMLPETRVSVSDTHYTTPEHALKIEYALSYINSSSHKINFDCDYLLVGEPDSLIIDIYNNGQPHYLKFYVTDGNNTLVNLRSAKFKPIIGWQRIPVLLRQFGTTYSYPARLKQISLNLAQDNAETDSIYQGTLFMDNLQIHGQPISAIKSETEFISDNFVLYQNYPNPFNSRTIINYTLPVQFDRPSHPDQLREKSISNSVDLSIYNLLGQKVANLVSGQQQAGAFSVSWDGSNCSSGVYFYLLTIRSTKDNALIYSNAKKLLLLK